MYIMAGHLPQFSGINTKTQKKQEGNSNLPLVVKCALQPGILRFATDPLFWAALCNNPLKIVTSTKYYFGVSVGLLASSLITPISPPANSRHPSPINAIAFDHVKQKKNHRRCYYSFDSTASGKRLHQT
jgi:hypothetical protein